MKLTNYLLILFAIEIAFLACGIDQVPMTSLASYIIAPQNFNSTLSTNSTTGTTDSALQGSSFSSLIRDLLFGVGGVVFIVGTFFIKNDLMVFAGASMIFLSFVTVFYRLANLVGNASNSILLFYIFISPLILLYFMAILSWWRGRD